MFGVLDEIRGEGVMWALAGSMGGTAMFVVSVLGFLAMVGVIWRYNYAIPQHFSSSNNLSIEENNWRIQL